ncbi:TetR/AcrR family transcriptional regulator [Brevibacillus fluminis]|uniref:TetR/AcrR family transcriptional regulator n=1 Tax=Brevibacillus fluminis TaxID=511487 RepID=A0A3M8DQF7_9BACL|nr:TetR/AcrR family transcriptional regulator [Brevibacillus fluminis]RNB89665.1 TetR/AcrR family transcriptional regulator [Brevibacillus fluminis]
MARHKEFDQEVALDKAMELFWQKGYDRTSMQDLCEHLGIHRGSLYDTFGDKHQLFLACIDRFQETAHESFYSILQETGDSRELLERFFNRVIDSSIDNASLRRGCFMANATMGVAVFEPSVASRVEAYFLQQETWFYRFLLRAQKNGELKGKQHIRELARFLVNTKQGLHVLAKSASDRSTMDDTVKVTLSFLF